MEVVAAILTLLGFLVLIAALLVHWSKDRSCEDERSAFSAGE